ncbi:MAG: S-layer homology domain-containing protein [Bacillota bacterium]
MTRRWMTATAALVLLASSSLPAFAATTTPSQPPPATETRDSFKANLPAQLPVQKPQPLFVDLPETHWAYTAVIKLIKAGAISAVPGGKFRPEEPVTRAELFKMVLIARKIDPAGKCEAAFFDVPCTAWYAPYAETAYRMAIAEGVGNRLFAPEDPVTREQLYTIVVRSLGKRWAAHQQTWDEINAALAPFSDRAEIDYYARPPLALALKEKLTAGYPDGTLRPKAVATRAEAAALVSRIVLETEGLQSITLDGHKVVFSKQVDLIASKYTIDEPDVGNITYTGVTVRTGAVAVDPTVIPLGTLLYVEGYGYAVAVDIGGAIKGNRIDLFSWEPGKEAYLFGLQPRKVWILP